MKINKDFITHLSTALLSSPIVYNPHYDYGYVEDALRQILLQPVHPLFPFKMNGVLEFDCGRGVVSLKDKSVSNDSNESLKGLLERLVSSSDFVVDEDKKYFFLLKNLSASSADNSLDDIAVQTLLQTFAEKYAVGEGRRKDGVVGVNSLYRTIVIVSPMPVSQLPQAVVDVVTVVDLPVPTFDEIVERVNDIRVSSQFAAIDTKVKDLRSDLARNLQGLQAYEVEQVLRSALCRTNGLLSRSTLSYVLEEKRQIVRKSGIIEVVQTDVSFNDVGGLDALRSDMDKTALSFENLRDVATQRLPLPKGVLIMGMPGCGKSLIAKGIANRFGVALLRLDISRLMGQYVGQSEENLRKALATAEAAHPCVLWIDEIEKAFHGTNEGGSGNDLVMRMMGYFLTWMQERKTAVYIVATANDVMRPEFMRKGRFDEVYFVDFPSEECRVDILRKKIKAFRKHTTVADLSAIADADINDIAKAMDGFAGAEIESVVQSVMSVKFNESVIERDKRLKDNPNADTVLLAVKVSKDDFLAVVEAMKDSVMSHQDNAAINGIRALRDKYNFKDATTGKPSVADELGALKRRERELDKQLEVAHLKKAIKDKEEELKKLK